MIIKIDKMSHDLRGIGKVGNKICFVYNCLPGEVASIGISSSKKNFDIGNVKSYIEKSSDRIISSCPYSDKCGGCDFDFVKYDKSLVYKKNMVIDIMKRYANICIDPSINGCEYVYGYRNKISLLVVDGKIGLRRKGSNCIVPISKCLLCNDNINMVIEYLTSISLNGINEVIIRGNSDIMVIFKGNSFDSKIVSNMKNIGIISSIVFNDKVLYGDGYTSILVNGYTFRAYFDSFFQVNTYMIGKIYDKAKEYAGKGKRLLDLYCGSGTIGIYLSDNFDYVYGIEINDLSIKSANCNKMINNISNISFKRCNANLIDTKNYDVILVDPPRGGLDKTTINNLLNSDALRIVYVSCNPITLARDIDLLKEEFCLSDICLFDNFPNTRHVESVCLLTRNS